MHKDSARLLGLFTALRAVVTAVTLSSCSWGCLHRLKGCGALLSPLCDVTELSPTFVCLDVSPAPHRWSKGIISQHS